MDKLFETVGFGCFFDITFFNVSEDESLGYLCGCNVIVMSDGQILFENDQTTEQMDVKEILIFNDAMRRSDSIDTCKLLSEDKEIMVTFPDGKQMQAFSETIRAFLAAR